MSKVGHLRKMLDVIFRHGVTGVALDNIVSYVQGLEVEITRLKHKADAYPRLVEALKKHTELIPDRATHELLKELGELE